MAFLFFCKIPQNFPAQWGFYPGKSPDFICIADFVRPPLGGFHF